MPAGPSQQIDRQVSSQLNAGTGDIGVGTSILSPTNANQYQGVLGSRVWLDSQTIRFKASVGTLYGGVYQYVFMTYTTRQPTLGGLVFWDNSVGEALYQVNGDAKPSTAIPTLVAGVVICATVVAGTYAWMCIGGRCNVLPDSAITSGTAGSGITAKVSASVASTVDSGTALAASTAGAIAGVDTLIGVSEATVTASTLFICQLNLMMRHF